MSSMEKQSRSKSPGLKRVRYVMGLAVNLVQNPKRARTATDVDKLHVHKVFLPCRGPVHVVTVKVESSLIPVKGVMVRASFE
jgi:hypothetical protein